MSKLRREWELAVRTLEALFNWNNRSHIGTAPVHYATNPRHSSPCMFCYVRYQDFLRARHALALLEPVEQILVVNGWEEPKARWLVKETL